MTNLNRASALCAGVAICAAGLWLALREPTAPTGDAQAAGERIPNFAPNDRISWYPDRVDGDQWLPPERRRARPDHVEAGLSRTFRTIRPINRPIASPI